MSRAEPRALADLTYPVLAYVLKVVDDAGRGQQADYKATSRQVRDMIREAEERAAGEPYGRGFSLVKRALAYWTDEVLINSEWVHRQTWEVSSLESEYYGERLRAVRFYEWSSRASDSEDADTGPLEHFLIALALGFRGIHRDDPAALEREAKTYLRKYLGRIRVESLGEGEEGAPLRALPGATMLLAVCALVAATALITLACFLWTHAPSYYRA